MTLVWSIYHTLIIDNVIRVACNTVLSKLFLSIDLFCLSVNKWCIHVLTCLSAELSNKLFLVNIFFSDCSQQHYQHAMATNGGQLRRAETFTDCHFADHHKLCSSTWIFGKGKSNCWEQSRITPKIWQNLLC